MQDVAAFAAHLPDDALRHPHAEHWVAGARLTEGGPLAPYAGTHCTEDRSLLVVSRAARSGTVPQVNACRSTVPYMRRTSSGLGCRLS